MNNMSVNDTEEADVGNHSVGSNSPTSEKDPRLEKDDTSNCTSSSDSEQEEPPRKKRKRDIQVTVDPRIDALCNQEFERNEEQSVILSEVSDNGGKVKVNALSRPFRQEQLKPQESYILDTISGNIYVWIGKQSTDREKSEAMAKAQQTLSSKNYPSWVKVTRILQGTEPAAFKQYFSTWRDVGMSHSRLV